MPQLAGKGTAGSSQAENSYAYRHDPPGLPTVSEAPSYRSKETINEDIEGQHYGGAPASPTKLVQNRGKEDGERVSDAVDEQRAYNGNADDNPTVKKARALAHSQSSR